MSEGLNVCVLPSSGLRRRLFPPRDLRRIPCCNLSFWINNIYFIVVICKHIHFFCTDHFDWKWKQSILLSTQHLKLAYNWTHPLSACIGVYENWRNGPVMLPPIVQMLPMETALLLLLQPETRRGSGSRRAPVRMRRLHRLLYIHSGGNRGRRQNQALFFFKRRSGI